MFFHFQIIWLEQETQNVRSVEIKDENAMIDRQNFFDLPVKNNLKMHNSILEVTIGQRDGYTTGCSLFYTYFHEDYLMIAIDFR